MSIEKYNRKKQNGGDTDELFPTGHLLNGLIEDEFFTVCKCVARREEIDSLHVYMLEGPDLVADVPFAMVCGKCDGAFNEPLLFKSENFVRFPKSNLPLTITYYHMKLLKRGINPEERITVSLYEFSPDFNFEEACRKLEEKLDEEQRRLSQ